HAEVLVDSLDQNSERLRCVLQALADVQGSCHGDELRSWNAYRRRDFDRVPLRDVVAEFGLGYHETASRITRMRAKVKGRIVELCKGRGLLPPEDSTADGHG
ncbi:MAG TPA: hypothetical protein VE988_28605, partial [Gemmataceae bacterium]|nr:hypothetical protein [Gemmataceae bacterium]